MNNSFYEARLIEWAILIATIAGAIIQPLLSFYLENKRNEELKRLKKVFHDYQKLADRYDKFYEGAKQGRKKLFNEGEESDEDIYKSIREIIEKNAIKFKENSCPNCGKRYEKIGYIKKNYENIKKK